MTTRPDFNRLVSEIEIEPTAAPSLNGEEPGIEPLFHPEDIRFTRFLASDPPARRWILKAGEDGVLPLGVAGLLAAMGGAGKSALVYQLAFSVTSGLPFLGMTVEEPGAFLYLAAEDPEDELHRRGHVLLSHYTALADMAGEPFDLEAVGERLHVKSLVAADNLLTKGGGDGEVHLTGLVERIVDAASGIPDLRALVLDPVSRFRGGKANHEEDATRFVEALESIRQGTGATVLGLSHVSQAGIREGGGQEIVRGSTALVDGVRWVATLQRLRRDRAKDYGVEEEDADRYLRLEIPKSNYAPPFPGLWIRREAGGVMAPTELEEVVDARKRQEATEKYLDVLARVQDLIRKHGPMTTRRIRDEFAGTLGVLEVGQHTVRQVISRAIEEEALLPRKGKHGDDLHLPEGE